LLTYLRLADNAGKRSGSGLAAATGRARFIGGPFAFFSSLPGTQTVPYEPGSAPI